MSDKQCNCDYATCPYCGPRIARRVVEAPAPAQPTQADNEALQAIGRDVERVQCLSRLSNLEELIGNISMALRSPAVEAVKQIARRQNEETNV